MENTSLGPLSREVRISIAENGNTNPQKMVEDIRSWANYININGFIFDSENESVIYALDAGMVATFLSLALKKNYTQRLKYFKLGLDSLHYAYEMYSDNKYITAEASFWMIFLFSINDDIFTQYLCDSIESLNNKAHLTVPINKRTITMAKFLVVDELENEAFEFKHEKHPQTGQDMILMNPLYNTENGINDRPVILYATECGNNVIAFFKDNKEIIKNAPDTRGLSIKEVKYLGGSILAEMAVNIIRKEHPKKF